MGACITWFDKPVACPTQRRHWSQSLLLTNSYEPCAVAGETEREPFIFFLLPVLYLVMTWVSNRVKDRLERRVAIVGLNR